jgi:hypothetical protein
MDIFCLLNSFYSFDDKLIAKQSKGSLPINNRRAEDHATGPNVYHFWYNNMFILFLFFYNAENGQIHRYVEMFLLRADDFFGRC